MSVHTISQDQPKQTDGTGPKTAAVNQLQLRQNDRVLFLGDSITEAGDQPNGYVALVRAAIDKLSPELKIEVIGAGISGNRVPDLQKRLATDVLDKRPTVVVIYIGINDVWHSQNGNGTPIEAFESGLSEIIGQIQKAGARVVLCTPSVIGEKHDGGNQLDSQLEEFSATSRRVAEQTGSHLLDLRRSFIEYLSQNNKDNRPDGILTTDGVHLNAAGNRFVAEQMLRGLEVERPETGHTLRHVVLFNFNDDLPSAKVDEVLSAFGSLAKQVDSIVGFESGINISVENLGKGFTHCFMVSFADVAGRDRYLQHSAHQKFVEFIDGKIEDVLVVDFSSK